MEKLCVSLADESRSYELQKKFNQLFEILLKRYNNLLVKLLKACFTSCSKEFQQLLFWA